MSKDAIEEINRISQVAIAAATFFSVTLVLILQLDAMISFAIILPVLVAGILMKIIMARRLKTVQSPCKDTNPLISCPA